MSDYNFKILHMSELKTFTKKTVNIVIEKPVESFSVDAEVSELLPNVLEAYNLFKFMAEHEDSQVDEDGDNHILFWFEGFDIVLRRFENGLYGAFYYNDKDHKILAYGFYDAERFGITKKVGERYKKIDTLFATIALTGIYFSNPNVMDKLKC